jgi:hypothetical protein
VTRLRLALVIVLYVLLVACTSGGAPPPATTTTSTLNPNADRGVAACEQIRSWFTVGIPLDPSERNAVIGWFASSRFDDLQQAGVELADAFGAGGEPEDVYEALEDTVAVCDYHA